MAHYRPLSAWVWSLCQQPKSCPVPYQEEAILKLGKGQQAKPPTKPVASVLSWSLSYTRLPWKRSFHVALSDGRASWRVTQVRLEGNRCQITVRLENKTSVRRGQRNCSFGWSGRRSVRYMAIFGSRRVVTESSWNLCTHGSLLNWNSNGSKWEQQNPLNLANADLRDRAVHGAIQSEAGNWILQQVTDLIILPRCRLWLPKTSQLKPHHPVTAKAQLTFQASVAFDGCHWS